MLSKAALRQSLLKQRNSLSEEERFQSSDCVAERLVSLDIIKNARAIGVYWAHQSEIDLRFWMQDSLVPLYTAVVQNKASRELAFVRFKPAETSLKKGTYGLMEPEDQSEICSVDQLSVILMPLVGFTLSGFRLGFGGGFYDRALANGASSPVLIGIAFDWQESHFEPDSWDKPMHLICTDKRLIDLRENAL